MACYEDTNEGSKVTLSVALLAAALIVLLATAGTHCVRTPQQVPEHAITTE